MAGQPDSGVVGVFPGLNTGSPRVTA
jgi:hypothetical protein